jgi:CheY-like chemotaxis protein
MNATDSEISADCRSAVESIRQKILSISTRQKPRILIVEDSPQDAELLCHQIGQQCVPCDIEVSHTCEDALETLRRSHFDLVFVDLKFPHGMGGTDLLRAVGDETDRATFIVVSGLSDDDPPMRDAMRAGAAAIFRKPFTDRQLQGICGMMAIT